MALNLITPPAADPVSLSEIKRHLRVDDDDTSQDSVITALSMSAVAWAEAFTRRRFVRQTWRLALDGFYADRSGIINLPYPPVEAIDAFRYLTTADEFATLDPTTGYVVDLLSNPARLTPPFGQSWPVARIETNAVQIDFICGYALPVTVGNATFSPPDPTRIEATDYIFEASDLGRLISIPGAGPDGGTLHTAIREISSPPDSHAVLRNPTESVFEDVTALLVNSAHGNPAHWALITAAVKLLVTDDFDKRRSGDATIYTVTRQRAKDLLGPVRDLRF